MVNLVGGSSLTVNTNDRISDLLDSEVGSPASMAVIVSVCAPGVNAGNGTVHSTPIVVAKQDTPVRVIPLVPFSG